MVQNQKSNRRRRKSSSKGPHGRDTTRIPIAIGTTIRTVTAAAAATTTIVEITTTTTAATTANNNTTTTTEVANRIDPHPFSARGACLGVETILARHRTLVTPATDPVIKTQQVIMAAAMDEEEERMEEDEAEEDKEEVEKGVLRRTPQ